MSEANLVECLNEEFRRRQQNNRRYSLRAYARDLEIDASYLSKILNGSRAIPLNLVEPLSRAMRLSDDQIVSLEESYFATRYAPIKNDEFLLIADWLHIALLCFSRIRTPNGGTGDFAERAAQALRSTPEEIRPCLERLLRMGLLRETADGTYEASEERLTAINPSSSEARLRLQGELLLKSKESLRRDPFDQRDHSGMTMAIDSSKIPQAKLIIRRFRRELCELLESSENADHVYHLCLSLFPLTELESNGTPK